MNYKYKAFGLKSLAVKRMYNDDAVVAPYASLIVFLIFTYLGIKFIKEAFDKKSSKPLCISLLCLFLLAIAIPKIQHLITEYRNKKAENAKNA